MKEVKGGYYDSNNRPKVGDLVQLVDDYFTRREVAEGEDVWLGPMKVVYDNTLCVQVVHPIKGEGTFYFDRVVPYSADPVAECFVPFNNEFQDKESQ